MHVPLADRRSTTFRNIPVLRLWVPVWGRLLQNARRKSARSKPSKDAAYE
jgi:hypothetical protein